MAVVRIKLNGYVIGSFWAKVDVVEVSGEGGRRSGVYGTGWPRAAAISAKSARVLSWKSGSRVWIVSFIRKDGGVGVTKKNICFVNHDPFNVLKSHFGFDTPG